MHLYGVVLAEICLERAAYRISFVGWRGMYFMSVSKIELPRFGEDFKSHFSHFLPVHKVRIKLGLERNLKVIELSGLLLCTCHSSTADAQT